MLLPSYRTALAAAVRGNLIAVAVLTVLANPGFSIDFDITSGLGPVWAVRRAGDKVFLGGWFNYVGPRTGHLAAVHAVTGDPLATFPKVDGYVLAVASDGHGGWFITGRFTHVGGALRSGLAHIRSDRTVSGWRPETDGQVETLAVSGNVVYIGGDFDTIDGRPRENLGAIHALSGQVLPGTPSANDDVRSLAVDDSTLYVGGLFDTIGGQARVGLAAVELASGMVTTWNPDANGKVDMLHLAGSDLFVVGGFSQIGSQSRSLMAAVNVQTAMATSFDPRPSSAISGTRIEALAIDDSTVYVGGSIFRSIGGQRRQHFAALDRISGQATSWDPAPDSFVYALAISDHQLFLGGSFRSVAGERRARTAAFDLRTKAILEWNPGAGLDVLAMAAVDSTVCLGGAFESVGGEERTGLAALDARSGRLSPWGPNGTNGKVWALVATESTLYVGGDFTTIDGAPRNRLAAVDLRTGSVTSWDPNVEAPTGLPIVTCLARGGSTIYAGGTSTSVGGQSRENIAEIDAQSGEPTAWNPGADSSIRVLSVRDGTVYAGGHFRNIGGAPRNFVAALNASTGTTTSWNPNSDGRVHAMALDESVVYLGGEFWTIGGQRSQHLAAVDLVSGRVVTEFPEGGVSDAPISALTLVNGELFVGGSFWWIWYQLRSGLASVRTELAQLTDWSPSVAGASAMDIADQQLYVGTAVGVVAFPLRKGSRPFAPPKDELQALSPPFPVFLVSPNPTAGPTRVDFALGRPGTVRLRVLDVAGRTVSTLIDGDRPAGPTSVTWHNTHHASPTGVYFVALEYEGRVMARRLVYLR
jgi:hypothetical protein